MTCKRLENPIIEPAMGWLRLVGCLKLHVSFAEYCLFHRAFLQKRPIILRSKEPTNRSYPLWPSPPRGHGAYESIPNCFHVSFMDCGTSNCRTIASCKSIGGSDPREFLGSQVTQSGFLP